MENKYYTPDISEFHVGFEYESEWGAPDHYTAEWHDEVFSKVDSIENLCERLRVKYLDQEDIESLGFENVEGNERFAWFKSGKWIMQFNIGHCYIHTGPELNQLNHRHFAGYIKNKSELKMVLKMIGYESRRR